MLLLSNPSENKRLPSCFKDFKSSHCGVWTLFLVSFLTAELCLKPFCNVSSQSATYSQLHWEEIHRLELSFPCEQLFVCFWTKWELASIWHRRQRGVCRYCACRKECCPLSGKPDPQMAYVNAATIFHSSKSLKMCWLCICRAQDQKRESPSLLGVSSKCSKLFFTDSNEHFTFKS